MLTVLSLLDDRLRPKGSRDPLAIEAIWSSVGRRLVGNLTTVTSRIDHFLVALMACRYAHEGAQSRSLDDVQDRYMRAEQLAAYLRLEASTDASLLGRQLAVANFRRGSMPLGMHKKAQILSNQLSYGLWGLYSAALQEAGLIKGSDRQLTPCGVALTDAFVQVLGDAPWQRLCSLAGQTQVSKDQLTQMAPAFVKLLKDVDVRQRLARHLLLYVGARPLQVTLHDAVQQWLALPDDRSQPHPERHLALWILDAGPNDESLRRVMQQILLLQPVLVFASTVVVWLQLQQGRTRDELIHDLGSRLSEPFLKTGWDSPGLPHAGFLARLADAANRRDAGEVIDHLLAQNASVMSARGGAAWLYWEGNTLKVRVPVDRASLPEDLAEYCHTTWDYSFFLRSFISIAKAGRP